MNKLKFFSIIFGTGFVLYLINTLIMPIPEKLSNNVSQYWFQQAYFRNESYLQINKIRDKNLLTKLEFHSKDLKQKNNINTEEYLIMYLEYIYQMEQLSRIILELGKNGQFIMNDIVYIINNIKLKNLTDEELLLIKQTSENIKVLIKTRDKINSQNKELKEFRTDIKEKFNKYYNEINRLKSKKSSENNISEIVFEMPIVALIGKVKYNQNLGLYEPDYLLKPLRTFGIKMEELNSTYNQLLAIYNKQSKKIKIWNTVLNYIIYLISIGLLLFEVKNKSKYNKS